MKKRLYAVLMASVLLVAIMAGSAFAASSFKFYGPYLDRTVQFTPSQTGWTRLVTETSDTITLSADIYVGQVLPISVDIANSNMAKWTSSVGKDTSNATITETQAAGSENSNVYRYNIVGSSAGGSTTFTFKSADASFDYTIKLKVTVKEPKFTWGSNVPGDGKDIGYLKHAASKAFFPGEHVSIDLGSGDALVTMTVPYGKNAKGTSVKAEISPKTSGLTFDVTAMSSDKSYDVSGIYESTKSADYAYAYKGILVGDVAELKADTNYTLKITATDAGGKTATRSFTFTVWANPVLGESTPTAITWGDPTWAGFSPSVKFADEVIISNDLRAGGDKQFNGGVSQDALLNSADIKFTWKGNATSGGTATFELNNKTTGWKPGRNNTYIISPDWNGNDYEKNVTLIAKRGVSPDILSVDQTYTFTFKGTGPTWLKTGDAYGKLLKGVGFKFSQDIGSMSTYTTSSSDYLITFEAPGPSLDIDSSDLPAGIVIVSYDNPADTTKTQFSVAVSGDPKTTVNGDLITLTAKNKFGESSISIPLYIGTDKVSFDTIGSWTNTATSTDSAIDPAVISGDRKVGDSVEFKLKAIPGPIDWTFTNLPAGLTLEVDSDNTENATLTGTLTTATASEATKDKHFVIRAANKYQPKVYREISQDLMVWAVPTITAPSSTTNLATNKAIKVPFTVENLPKVTSFDISIGGQSVVSADNQDKTKLKGNQGYAIKGRTPSEGYAAGLADAATSKYFISVDIDALSKDRKVVFIGSTDRVPENGEPLTVSITAENFAGKTTEEFTLTFKGVEPKVAKTDVSLKWDTKTDNGGKNTSKDVKLSAGDELVTVTAVIDAKTAKKVFGIDSEINLMDENDENRKKAGLSVDQVDSKGTLKVAVISSQDAYSKLPIKVTAENPDVSSKASTAVYSLTVAGTAPTWSADKDALSTVTATGVTTNLKDNQADGSKALPAAVTINMKAGGSLGEEGIKLHANGSGPFTYSVKPASKNGIDAFMSETEERTLIIKGNADDVKKDTATKFTVEAKNNSTGASAKIAVTVNIIPKVAVAENEIASKNLTFGKKVNLKPKTTSTGKNVTWYVLDSGRADLAVPTNTALTADVMKTEADDLKNNFGLVLDTKKGALTGTPTISTGSENPIVVYAVASGDIERSDPVKYTVTVLGEKVKLTTKSVTITAEDPNFDSVKIETNVTGKATEAADISVNNSKTTTNFADITEVAALELADKGDKTNQFTLSGTPSGVTKKAAVTLTMNNYDTTSTGKLSVVVTGSTPTIEATDGDTVAVDAGSEGSTSVAITNTEYVSSKIKWKITDKPTLKGVSAKLTDNKDGTASITVKAGAKVKTGDTTFKVQATDGISKKSSEKLTITVNVTGAEESTEEAATVLSETSTELEETEKTALGEGEVIMGAQRTAGSLTAGQRAYIEQQGYVIAAVLPQIEVTADGQYDFEVDLDEKVATGAELVWFAFASKPTTDDEIVDFADKDNNETKVVPESHVVIVTPWLNAGTKYAPVIAVKANAAEADAMTEEGVKEAAEEEQEQAE